MCSNRKGQQYDCKWYIPLADLTFQAIEDCESSPIPLVQDEEIDAIKIKISLIKNEIQKEKVKILNAPTKTHTSKCYFIKTNSSMWNMCGHEWLLILKYKEMLRQHVMHHITPGAVNL